MVMGPTDYGLQVIQLRKPVYMWLDNFILLF